MSISKVLVARTLQLLRQPATSRGFVMSANRSPTILPADTPIDEERIPGYDPKRFLPVNPGDLLNNRYKIVVKVGWGTTSTVWLAQDTQRWWWNSNRYVTVKITASDCVDDDAAKHERIITRHLNRNPSHEGFPFVRTMLDHFEAPGQDGPHLCLVYEPMREPLWLFQRRWENGKLPPALLKVYLRFLLRALDYLHSECHIIHTDLKLDNILLGFEHPSVIEDFVQKQAENPMPRKIKDGRSIYLSHNDFGPPKSFRILPKIADFGLAQSGEGSEPLMHPIQPHLFHAPEVLLGTSWTYSADIWNLGVLIWNMMEGRDLFTHIRSSQGDYDVRAHLAEMIALLGAPPKILIDREIRWSEVKWSHAVPNLEGKLCQTAREYYGGPFFNSEGEFMHKDLIPIGVRLEDFVLSLEREDKHLFLDFIKKMLQWLPEDRKTAKELLEDPWLQEKST
ncbi:CMGC protein kinase [Mollisia scopiformis]|uniref:CMGC protein kinase n=1 Tax=Mollisia scopiformis TaxID=149040 RepID=A0A194X2G0_MOLSC|nr:CMGC protein kinase [Mollisia scopiformis]KUJ14194.1 CMGC protein kinase [Mollisia scopiformis]